MPYGILESGRNAIKNVISLIFSLRAAFRVTAVLLITALLIPLFFLSAGGTVSAQRSRPAPAAPESGINSAPPEPFVLATANSSLTTYFAGSFAASIGSIGEFFSPPQLPREFSNAKVPSVSERAFSSIGSVLGFFLPSKAAEPEPAPVMYQPSANVDFDFDGDHITDISRWQPSSTEWRIKNSSNGSVSNLNIGSSSSVVAPGDFDGDGTTDRAVFTAGAWTVKQSSNGNIVTMNWGTTGDKPVVADYDGDGKDDYAIFRPSTNYWWIFYSQTSTYGAILLGSAGDITAQADYDGDGKADVGVFHPANGNWSIIGTTSGASTFAWGMNADVPVPADYDYDGKTDFAIFRPSTGVWWIYKSSNNTYYAQAWGNYGDQPVSGDYDGDHKADVAVWRPTNGVWYILRSSDSTSVQPILGQAGDIAASSAYIKQVGGQATSSDLARARLSPKNATGGTNLYSRNFGWENGLVGLQGRADFAAGIGISYNSLVWTKQGSNIFFDADYSNVSPGFRLGFSTIEPVYFDAVTQKYTYLMVTPSGSRIEFRQSTASNIYETADSTYAQLSTSGASNPNDPVENITITVAGSDGNQMTYGWRAGAFRCSEIKDRNGNYITVNHDNYGVLRTVTDTLGRVITVNYDNELYPTSITQSWKDNNGAGSAVTHTWATFAYTTLTIHTNFPGLTVVGPPDNTVIKVLQKITKTDGSYSTFDYNTWGQVKQINNYAVDNHKLNHVKINLPADAANPETDCPRFTETRTYAENFNSGNETIVNNSITENQSYALPGSISGTGTMVKVWQTGHPDNLISKSYFGAAGWLEGIPVATEDCVSTTCSGADRKRWTWTGWTQDNTTMKKGNPYPYIINPRVVERRIGDGANTKRVTTEYHAIAANSPIALYGLVKVQKVYGNDLSTVLRQTIMGYNLDTPYVSRRILGLPASTELYANVNSQLALVSKTTYVYDEGNLSDSSLGQNISPIQHDNTNYGSGFVTGRGNRTSVIRWDATASEDPNSTTRQQVKYNTAGAIVSQADELGRTVKMFYADAFNDGINNRNTYAYPTRLTSPGGQVSTEASTYIKYRYDNGENVRADSPAPYGGTASPNTQGKITTRSFDAYGRLEQERLENTGEYTKYVYYPSQNIQETRTTLTDYNNNSTADSGDEVSTFSYVDGAGRPRATRVEHPGSTGGWAGQLIEYDILGRLKRKSVSTEIGNNLEPANWQPAGDDASRGWIWTNEAYDWKGRTVSETNADGTDKIVSYDGCGCAGGEIKTVKGEMITETIPGGQTSDVGRRSTRTYADNLGREYMSEVLNWDGSVYSSTVTKLNGLDQPDWVKQFDGAAPGDALNSDSCPATQPNQPQTCQMSKMTYDGFGRLLTKHDAQQDDNRSTAYEYYTDDQVKSITDARGAKKNLEYEQRGLLKQISYNVPTDTEALRPGISLAGRASGGDDIWMNGSNFASDITVVAFQNHIDVGGYQELARYTGSQITRGTTAQGEQTLTLHVTESQVIAAENLNRAQVYVINNASGRVSNFAYQMYNGVWNAHGGSSAEIVGTAPTVTFNYDDLGNKISMVDGVGRVDYEYDETSRMRSETRAFNDYLPQAPLSNNSYKTIYQYGFGSKLKSVTDPFGYQTNYTYDKVGRGLQVNGLVQFASNVKYRAWGGVKEVSSYGGITQSLTYDNRLRIATYQDSFASGIYSTFTYGYQSDGTLFKVDRSYQGGPTSTEVNYNRLYQFDNLARMTSAKSGKRARGETAEDCDVPFELNYTYDKFGNIVGRDAFNHATGARETTGSATYFNNRASIYLYDAEGRNVADTFPGAAGTGPPDIWSFAKYQFNAAGLLSYVNGVDYKQYLWQDGNGINAKMNIWVSNYDTGIFEDKVTNYDLQSSVLGEVIAKADKDGNRIESKVFGLGRELGKYKRQKITPTGSQYQQFQLVERSDPSGTYFASLGQAPDGSSKNEYAELTPEKVDVEGAMNYACPPDNNPPPPPVDRYDGWRFSSGFGDSGGCTIDGVESSCATAMGMLANGSGIEVALGTSYLDFHNPDGSTTSFGAYQHGWFPVDSFGSHQFGIDMETAQRLASPQGNSIASDWRTVIASSISAMDLNAVGMNDSSELIDTIYGPANGTSYVTVRASGGGTPLPQDEPTIIRPIVPDGSIPTDKQQKITDTQDAIKTILGGKNPCADFFGPNALAAFNSIKFQTGNILQTSPINTKGVSNHTVGISMEIGSVDTTANTNGYVSVTSAIINNTGAFFQSSYNETTTSGIKSKNTPSIGGYSSNGLQSRVMQMLHELAHIVVDKKTGARLLAVDGNNVKLSEENTEKVKAACKDQINALKN
jgi:YD repeat-containing protein